MINYPIDASADAASLVAGSRRRENRVSRKRSCRDRGCSGSMWTVQLCWQLLVAQWVYAKSAAMQRCARGVKLLFAACQPPAMGVMLATEPAPMVNVSLKIEFTSTLVFGCTSNVDD